MARRVTDSNKITTKQILAILKADKESDKEDHTKFFYLYVSTSEDDTIDEEQRKRKKRRLLAGQQTLDEHITSTSNSGMLESTSREDIDVGETGQVDNTENTSQLTELVGDNNAGVQNDQGTSDTQGTSDAQGTSDTQGTSDARNKAMRKIHDTTLPNLLYPKGWRKVCDKDLKPTYRALYFNTIKKEPDDEKDNHHMQRVNEIRKEVQEKAKEIMEEYNVKFKINSLLSRPLLYDEEALKEQSQQQDSTRRQQQTKLDDFFPKKP